jgi:hypothetical protein
MEGMNKSYANTPGGWLTARPERSGGVGYLIFSTDDMVELDDIKFVFQLSYLLLVCNHVGVITVQLSHDMIDDELRVSVDLKPLNPMFGGNAHALDQCLLLHQIAGGAEVWSNIIKELISIRRDQHYASPGTIVGERAIEIQAPMLLSDWGGC